MADAFYEVFRNAILGNVVHSLPDLNTDDVRIVLYDEGTDALNLADQDLADITAGARIAVSAAVGSPTVGTVAVGVFDHDNVTFTAVSGASVESLTYYKHTGTDSTSPLICNIDSATGLPVTPNGGDITWTPNSSGVFQIT
jgi:hypothetical protein